ncbi:hypothetical protein [Ancylobacter sp. FA202]|uniref:hypothetical protein n=1 Tax=Ancylobacter sp. FA202 TaxID=1111106 RepID=UPI0003A0E9F6|nr:hypothetical protein [Ancylobacter sp. FA202]
MANREAAIQTRRGRPRRATNLTILPPLMRVLFTEGENLVLLAVVRCLSGKWIGSVARRRLMMESGRSLATVEKTMRHARKVGLIREWDDPQRGYLTEIISTEWRAWLAGQPEFAGASRRG